MAIPRAIKRAFSSAAPASSPESVTKTRESVTVSAPKKRGGAVKC